MDYHGSDCTCIHSPSLVSLIHLFFPPAFSWDLWPSATNLYTHSLTHSCCLARALLLSLPISNSFSVFFFPLWFMPLKTQNYRNLQVQILEQRAFVCVRRTQTFGWRLNLFLSVTCFTTAPCCVHMGSLSHIEGRGAAYLCYWFSHWLRSLFGKWKHAVCRKPDLDFSLWDVCNVLVHRQELFWVLL